MTRRKHRRARECRTELRSSHYKVAPHSVGRVLIDGRRVLLCWWGELFGRVLGAHLGQHTSRPAPGRWFRTFWGKIATYWTTGTTRSGLTCLHVGLRSSSTPERSNLRLSAQPSHIIERQARAWAGLITPRESWTPAASSLAAAVPFRGPSH